MRKKITGTVVEALLPGAVVWDTTVTRFGVRRRAASRVYVVKYRAHGRQRWLRIGDHGSPWTPATARSEALRLLGLVAQGQDPAAAKMAGPTAPTVADLCDRFLTEHVTKKKPTTATEYRKMIARIIRPKLGAARVADVTRSDLAALHHEMRATPSGANRILMLCSVLFRLAEQWGLRPEGTSPTRHLEKYAERKRERYLTSEELGRLGAVLAMAERDGQVPPTAGGSPVAVSPLLVAAFRLALLTGARRSEVLGLRWEYLDLERGVARLPEHKTDRQHGAKTISLNAPAIAILRALPRIAGTPYVFPSTRATGHLKRVHVAWGAIRMAAGIPDVRLHDLRHSHASIGVSNGVPLAVVGRMLGHASLASTQRYAHIAPDPVRDAAELIGRRLTEAMDAGQ